MSEGMLHIRDVEGPKKAGSVEMRLEAMEQQVFKCQGMVERGLNANHMIITEFTSNHKMDAIDIGKHLSRLYDRVDQLQGQIYNLQNQNCWYKWVYFSLDAPVVPSEKQMRTFVRSTQTDKARVRLGRYIGVAVRIAPIGIICLTMAAISSGRLLLYRERVGTAPLVGLGMKSE
ncbi:40s ribosomal protein s5-1 [Hordeum vulgare]|nr:40s ribosomal protein s5-1 [Hordeum vulgare]